MKTLRESDFLIIEFDELDKIFKITWKPQTEFMEEKDFKTEMTEYSNFFNHGAEHVLHIMVDMKYTIVPEMQTWLDQNINTKGIAAGIRNAAFVLSSDIFTSTSVQQTNQELNAKKIPMQYFDDEFEAKKWLIQS